MKLSNSTRGAAKVGVGVLRRRLPTVVKVVVLPARRQKWNLSRPGGAVRSINRVTVTALPIEDFDKLVGGEPALQGWV